MEDIMEDTMTYRILNIDGTVSQKTFKVIGDSAGPKVTLRSMADNTDIRVHKNRMIPFEKSDQAICIMSGGFNMVICPKCLNISRSDSDSDEFSCENGCGTYQCHNLLTKSSIIRSSKQMSLNTRNQFSLEDVQKYTSMVVFQKTNKFNHPNIDSRSIVIIHRSDKPRKMQFNTYNGSLGKKAQALPLEAFERNEPPQGKCPWVAIASAEAEENRLKNDGYEQIV
jgi:hypothetical protein